MAEEIVLDFDGLEPIEVPFKLFGRDYILREPSEDAAAKFRNANLKGLRMQDGKVSGAEGLADSQKLLLSQCLYYADKDGNLPLDKDGDPDPRFLVAVQRVGKWPARVAKPIFERAKELGKLAEDETEESLVKQIAKLQEQLARKRGEDPAKNAPAPTPDTSASPTD